MACRWPPALFRRGKRLDGCHPTTRSGTLVTGARGSLDYRIGSDEGMSIRTGGWLAALLTGLLMQGCAGASRQHPESAEDLRSMIVVGTVTGFTDLEEHPDCGQVDEEGNMTLCLDPPPFQVHIDVRDYLYGPRQAKSLRPATVAHYGKQAFLPMGAGLRMFHVVTDGSTSVIPRNESVLVITDTAGRLAIPRWSTTELWWMPCETRSLVEKIDFPDAIARPRERVHLGYLESYPQHLQAVGDDVKPNLGIYLDKLKKMMDGKSIGPDEMTCREAGT